MSTEKICSKCNGALIEGFVLDQAGQGSKAKQIWIEGRTEYSAWSGIKVKDKETFTVSAFRCPTCNYLEFYTSDRIYL